MAAQLSPVYNDAQFDNNGDLLVGGLIWWYVAGTSTLQNTYSDAAGLIPNTNPIVLNARGESANAIRLGSGLAYKAVLEGPPEPGFTHGAVIRPAIDQITGVGDVQLVVIDGGTYT